MIGRNSQLRGKSNTSSIVNTMYSLELSRTPKRELQRKAFIHCNIVTILYRNHFSYFLYYVLNLGYIMLESLKLIFMSQRD